MMGLYLLAAHFLGDWYLQSDAMASGKFRYWDVRLLHVAIYTVTVGLTYGLAATPSGPEFVVFLLLVGVPHYIIDSKRWKEPVEGFPTRALWFDQGAHIITLAAAVAFVGVL